MNVETETLNAQLSDELREYVEQRLRNGLRRFEHRIAGIAVSFTDVSGPYWTELWCFLTLNLAPGGRLSVERRGASVRLALSRAIETALRELRRGFEPREEPGRRVA